jgi:hypothetical protein
MSMQMQKGKGIGMDVILAAEKLWSKLISLPKFQKKRDLSTDAHDLGRCSLNSYKNSYENLDPKPKSKSLFPRICSLIHVIFYVCKFDNLFLGWTN